MKNSSDRDSWDDVPIKLGRKKKPILAMGEDCPVEETAAFLIKATMVPIMEYKNCEIVEPLSPHVICSDCNSRKLCAKRVKNELPAMCESIFKTDILFLERHDLKELEDLKVIKEWTCT